MGRFGTKTTVIFFSFETYDKIRPTLLNLTAYLYSVPPGKDYALIERIIRAREASYVEGTGWVAPRTQVVRNLHTPGFPRLEHTQNQILPLFETPDDFKEIEADITTLDVVKLFGYIRKLSENNINVSEYSVLFLEKFSMPLTCLIFALLPSILIFYPNRRTLGLGKIITLIVAFSIVYWPVNSYLVQMGTHSKLNPFAACFAIPLIFVMGLSLSFYKHRKLG